MNGGSQKQGGKKWNFPKEISGNRFFCDSLWLEIWKNHHALYSMGPNGGLWTLHCKILRRSHRSLVRGNGAGVPCKSSSTWFSFRSPVRRRESSPQSTHREAMAAFWRTLPRHDGKIRPGWWGWGCTVHAHLLSPYLPPRRDEIGGVYLLSQLERTLQLCTWW